MKGIQSNGFIPIIAQAIAEMEEEFGEFRSIAEINLAELSRRTGLSRSKLRRLKANGFRETPHGLVGQRKEQILDGYTAVLDGLLRSGISNSSTCMERLQSIGFQGSRSSVKRYIAAHKNLIPGRPPLWGALQLSRRYGQDLPQRRFAVYLLRRSACTVGCPQCDMEPQGQLLRGTVRGTSSAGGVSDRAGQNADLPASQAAARPLLFQV